MNFTDHDTNSNIHDLDSNDRLSLIVCFISYYEKRVWKKKSIRLRHVHLMFENDDVFPSEFGKFFKP